MKNLENSERKCGQRPWPPVGIDWYYSDSSTAIACGDCLEIMPHLEPVDLVLTDIPFNVNHPYESYQDNLSYLEYATIVKQWFQCFTKISKFFIIKSPTKTMPIILPIFADILGYIWTVFQHSPNTTTHGPFNLSLITQYLIGGIPIKRPNTDYFVNTKNKLISKHPAEMPVQPIKILLNWFTEMNNLICDPMCGSGTTLVAAKELGRKAIGIEIEEKYVKIAIDRLRQDIFPFPKQELT